jgi:hypothetical protein
LPMKRCPRCGLEQPIESFAGDRGRYDGRRRICKACDRLRSTAWYAANRERALARFGRNRIARQARAQP